MREPAKTKQKLAEEIIILKKRIKKMEQVEKMRKQSEDLLEQERSLYLDMVNTQPAGIYRIRVFPKEKWKKDAWGVLESAPYSIELASERFCEILGITREVFESTPGIVEEMVHPEDKEDFARRNIEANARLIPFQWEGRLCVGQKIIWAHFESLPRPVANGDVLWTGFLYDITERKKAENALRKSEDKYRTLVDTTDTGFVIIDNDGIVQDANAEYVRLTGHRKLGDIIGRKVIEWTADFDKEKNAAAVRECFAKGYIRNLEINYVDAKGKLTPVEINATCLENEGRIQTITLCRDITKRRHAVDDLHKSENKYKLVTEKMTDIVWLMDMNLQTTYVSPSIQRALGFSPVERMCQAVHEQLTPDSLSLVGNLLAEELALEAQGTANPDRSLSCVLEYYHKDGSTRWFENNITGIRDEQGVLIGLHGVSRDITDRRRAEEALKKSEESYRALFEKHSAVNFVVDPDNGDIVDANEAAVKYYGWSREQLTKMKIQEINTLSPEEIKEELENARNNNKQHFEFRHRRADGSIRDVEVFSGRVEINRKPFLHSIVHDITNRRLAESQREVALNALQESQERLSGFMNSAMDSFYLLDSKLHFLEINENGLKIVGKKREEVIGKDIREIVPDVVESGRYAEHLKVIRTGEPFVIENHVPHPIFGNLFFILKSFKVADGIGVIASDITQLRKAEEEKHYLEERLQRAEKMEALGTLAGGVAHDLNNVLGVIVGYAELLLNEVAKESPLRPRLEKIMNGSEKAAAIVQDLLTLARRGVPVKQIVNLNKIIIDSQKSLESERLSSYHAGVRIKLELEPDLLNISGSSVHLGKALFNLVSNAMEAMPGGGEVIIRTVNQYLDKPISGYDEIREGDYVMLSVSDTGQGIPAADLQRIFEPFYTKKVMGRSGTGLGLAVIWGTVKDHHGYINVQSEEEKGSTFTLYFPVTREDVTIEAASVPVSRYMGKGESILVVDDVREQRELASEMLTKLNYKVAISASGEEAVAYLQNHKVNLLVLDMIMDPGMDGFDTYKEVLKIYPQQKAIIVSGFSETERVNQAHALGAGAYLKKPYVLEKLGMTVRKELDRK